VSLIESASNLPPLEKISILLNEVERLGTRMDNLTNEQSIDELLDVLHLDELSEQFSISQEQMRKKLKLAGGKVFKLGKKYVIRKVNFLCVLETLEQGVCS
jgi:hypothetical protein